MKAFLLAAGEGTRLRPITDRLPKCLVAIRGTPMLEIWIDLCHRFGISEMLINLHSHSDIVRDYLNRRSHPVKISVSEERELLGSAGTVAENRRWVANEKSFWIFYADVLTNANLERMRTFHCSKNGVATLAVYEVPDPSRCGVVVADTSGRILEFEEKPKQPKSNLAFAGLMIATPQFLDAIPDRVPADIGFDVIPRIADRSYAYKLDTYTLDIGTMANYNLAQTTWPETAVSRE